MKFLIGFLMVLFSTQSFAAMQFQALDGTNLGPAHRFICGEGMLCTKSSNGVVQLVQGTLGASDAATFTDSDATPDVSNGSHFETNTSSVTVTDFDGDDIYEGQVIVVVSKGAITYDVTSSGIVGGTTDIITAAGDVTTFMYDGTDWLVTARIDISDDLN